MLNIFFRRVGNWNDRRMFQWQLTRAMQRSLEYYCSRAGSSSARPPIMLTFERKKRPVGRPRKTAAAKHETCQPRPTLVDYSSTDSENEESSNENGDPPVATKKRLHRMYPQSQKKMVAYYARQTGIRKAATHYGIHHRWVKDQVTVLKNPRTCANKKGQGRKISYPQELEDQLVSWILQKQEEQFVAVSTQYA